MLLTKPSRKIGDFLEKRGVSFEIISHNQVFSTIEEARELNIEADEIAKSLMIYDRGHRMLLVMPGGHKVDNRKLRRLGSKHARLATEEELSEDFAEYELGAIPPIGELLHTPVSIDRRLLEHETVIFNAGTHQDSIKMSCKKFVALNNAQIVDVAREEEEGKLGK